MSSKDSQTFGRSRSVGISASVDIYFVLFATHSYPYSLAKSQTRIILPVFSTLLGSIANLTIAFPANSTDSALAKWSCPESVDFRISESEEKKILFNIWAVYHLFSRKMNFEFTLRKNMFHNMFCFHRSRPKWNHSDIILLEWKEQI